MILRNAAGHGGLAAIEIETIFAQYGPQTEIFYISKAVHVLTKALRRKPA